jgi:hypothetical protein
VHGSRAHSTGGRVASHGSELVVIVRNRVQAFEAAIVHAPALGRLTGGQMHGVHYSPDDIPPTEDALVREEMKTLLSPVEDYAAPWRLLVFNFGGYCTYPLEPRPIINVPRSDASGQCHRVPPWRAAWSR